LIINIPVGILQVVRVFGGREVEKLEKTEVAKEKGNRPRTPAAERVLEAASRLFYERGIRAVGVDAIAEDAGVTKVTIYKNFGSKDGLVVAYLRARDERWRGWLEEAVERRAGSPGGRILAIFDALGEWLESEAGYRGCAFVNAATEIADRAHPAHEVMAEQKRWMLGYFARLAREAGIGEPEELAGRLLILFEGANVTHALRTGHEPIRQARATAAALIPGEAG
jgi:AcrR family transcriptional regulator